MGKIVDLAKYKNFKAKKARETLLRKFREFLDVSDDIISRTKSKKAAALVKKGKKLIKDSEDVDDA